MKMKMIIVAALAFVGLTATAQRQEKVVDRVDQRTVQEFDHQDVTKKFKSHLFLDIQGGAQYTLGEAKFGDLISPNVQLGLGYQFTPWFAARLQANGWQSKGGWNSLQVTQYSSGQRLELGSTSYKWNYVAPGIDFIFDLTNLIGGWNPERFFSAAIFVGGGANIAWKNDDAINIDRVAQNKEYNNGNSLYKLEYLWDGTKVNVFGRGGLQLGFRLSPAVSLLLEGNANILTDKYNSKKAGNADWYFNALAGLRINLGKAVETETHDVYRDVVVYDTIYKYVTIPEPVKKIEKVRRDVFFEINKYEILSSEAGKIQEIANFLKENPKAKVQVTGYADVQTGNPTINDRLARQRADVVVKALIEQYEIAADRISYDSKGDREQPFAENGKNRVSIMIAE
jgi:outer membrane protein OmpA-like peptidoglycan-associated protein